MVDPGDLLPNPEHSSDEDELSENEFWDSNAEDPPEPWLLNSVQPADPNGFSIYYTNVQSLKYKLDQIYHETYRLWHCARHG